MVFVYVCIWCDALVVWECECGVYVYVVWICVYVWFVWRIYGVVVCGRCYDVTVGCTRDTYVCVCVSCRFIQSPTRLRPLSLPSKEGIGRWRDPHTSPSLPPSPSGLPFGIVEGPLGRLLPPPFP